MVPYIDGTVRVDIEREGAVVASVTAGINPPVVRNVAPSGGTLSDDTIRVVWEASDPDGDPLSFEVEFSRDNGATWAIVAQNLTEPFAEVDRANLASTTTGLFRVWATDGIHSGSGQSSQLFSVANLAPRVSIAQQARSVSVAISQTLALIGEVYDVDEGELPADRKSVV